MIGKRDSRNQKDAGARTGEREMEIIQ